MRFAIVVSSFHATICNALLAEALAYFEEVKNPVAEEDLFFTPGAFELPLLAKKLAKTKRYDGILSLGCVIKGETAHFEYISSAVAWGIQMLSLEMEVPIAFGVLNTYTRAAAEERASSGEKNKGREAARACWEMTRTLQKLEKA